eukprot:GHUV01007377.1.p1 GENE.GHUV01007377.1~~GHUV01007377.1.p1  ORF type:complete len:273 (+),score=56.46 GHUV01007377.1:675-1493(+)
MDIRNAGLAVDTVERVLKLDPSIKQQQIEAQQLDAEKLVPYLYVFHELWQVLQSMLPDADSRLLCRIMSVGSKVQWEDMGLYDACLQHYIGSNMAEYGPRNISNVIYALCTAAEGLKPQLSDVARQQLVPAFVQLLHASNAQDISNVLYGLAGCGIVLKEVVVQKMIVRLLMVLDEAKLQAVANTLWAVATMEQNLRADQLKQLVGAVASNLSWARALDVSHTLWACAKFAYLPEELLSSPQVLSKVATAGNQELSNIAWACGGWGIAMTCC